jgi:hypothetical protein
VRRTFTTTYSLDLLFILFLGWATQNILLHFLFPNFPLPLLFDILASCVFLKSRKKYFLGLALVLLLGETFLFGGTFWQFFKMSTFCILLLLTFPAQTEDSLLKTFLCFSFAYIISFLLTLLGLHFFSEILMDWPYFFVQTLGTLMSFPIVYYFFFFEAD